MPKSIRYAVYYNGIAGWIVGYINPITLDKKDESDYIDSYDSLETAREIRDICCHLSTKDISKVI